MAAAALDRVIARLELLDDVATLVGTDQQEGLIMSEILAVASLPSTGSATKTPSRQTAKFGDCLILVHILVHIFLADKVDLA